MIKRKKYTKYMMVFALIAILTFIWGCPADIIEPTAVTEIAVTGEADAITVVYGSTLQMSAAILPTDAFDPSITWSVEEGTGLASISETGLLSANGVGTVTVIATANDGSNIIGTQVITVTEDLSTPSSLASYDAVILTQTGDVANDNVQYSDALAVIAVLPTQIEVTLDDSTTKNIPLTWTDTDIYDATIAADYTFTSTYGTIPEGANNDNNLAPPMVELTVKEGVLLVTSITVNSEGDNLFVILDENLQMTETVLPLLANDPSVSWSVVEGTGNATIDQTGLLTGTKEGTVIVKATANDSSAIEGTKEITVNKRPFIASNFPVDEEIGVSISTNIEVSFNEAMALDTIIPLNFTVSPAAVGSSEIVGSVNYDELTKTAVFNPDIDLLYDTQYIATVKAAVTDLNGAKMIEDNVWIFTTATEMLAGTGPALINLRSASNFAILAKSAITTTGNTLITGDIGVSPAALSDLTGFSAALSLDGTSAISSYVTGKIYASDMKEPTPSTLTTAISDVEAAYVEAAGRVDDLVQADLYGGIIDGQTFAPGIYKWDTVVTMATDITLQGGVNDVWIFQVADNMTISSGASVLLADGAQAKNIFYQVAGIVTLGTGSHLEGIIMGMTQIVLETGSSVHGKLLAQTQVTLDTATVTPL